MPVPGVLTVCVTMNGDPAPGESVFVYDLSGRQHKVTEMKADNTGVVRVESVEEREVYVLPRSAHELVAGAKDDRGREGYLKYFPDLYARVVAQMSGNIFLELGEGDFCRLEIGFDRSEVKDFRSARLTGRQNGEAVHLMRDGTTFTVPRLRKGTYRFAGKVRTTSHTVVPFAKLIEVTDSPQQSIAIDVSAHPLSVNVEGLKDASSSRVWVGVYQRGPNGLATVLVEGRHADNNGNAAFELVPEGDFELRAWIGRAPNDVTMAASKPVRISGETSATIRLDDSAGALKLQFAPGWSPPGARAMRVEVLDEHGEPTTLPDPAFALSDQSRTYTVPSVPPGRWTVRIIRNGRLPFVSNGVVIESGKTTELTVSSESAKCPRVLAERFMEVGKTRPRFTWTCEDEDGNQLVVELPDDSAGVAFVEDEGLLMMLYNMPENAARFILNVDGCEPVTIEADSLNRYRGKYFVTLQHRQPHTGD